MKYLKNAALVLIFWTASAGAAGGYTIKIDAANGKELYTYTHLAPAGEQANYAGKLSGQPGSSRGIILNTLAAKRTGGGIKLQYMFELAATSGANPPIQIVSEIALNPGIRTLAARGDGWEVFITATGPSDGKIKKTGNANYLLKADLASGDKKMPLSMAVSPGNQLTQVVYKKYGSKMYKYTFSALAGEPAVAGGEFTLQYSFTVLVNGKNRAEGSGEAKLKPGQKNKTAASGKNWKLSMGAERPQAD